LKQNKQKIKNPSDLKKNVTKAKLNDLPTKQFPIVGIGASAGGLAAFETFFSELSKNEKKINMAFILVQHLDPIHKSMLAEIVGRYTKLLVYEVEDGMKVKPDCVYIIPPNRDMALRSGKLYLFERQSLHTLRLPIDYFFHSLATDQHERAIGIILSGTGSDGTLGARAIKSEGGMIMAQKPASTEYNSMPKNAIEAGLVDYILLPSEMPSKLTDFTTYAFLKKSQIISPTVVKNENALKKIFILLQSQSGHDFSQYKPSTIIRRIERRMAVNQIINLNDYISLLQKNSKEINTLFQDLLIGVTLFFRDKEAFAFLKEQIIPALFLNKPSGSKIRVWIPGCSTGEEAYSIAILLQEHIDQLKQGFKLQIYATDIDSKAIEQARVGIYPVSIADDISPTHLERFFEYNPDAHIYRIKRVIRDLLIFSQQNLIKDPPFSKMDFISCRNLLIYLNSEIQQKIIPLFHYSLNPQGKLFLGSAETIGNFSHLFLPIDRKFKLYQKKDDSNRQHHPVIGLISPSKINNSNNPQIHEKISSVNKPKLRELMEHTLLKQYAPTSVLVDKEGCIFYIHGRSGRYLEPTSGKSELNILKMAREGLKHDLLKALNKSVKLQETIRLTGLSVKTNGDFSNVNLIVQPVNSNTNPKLYLVLLEEMSTSKVKNNIQVSKKKSKKSTVTEDDTDLAILKQKLIDNEEFLQNTNEQLETTNEELRSSNEEMQSINEELQSTNEELETSKEELQSVNEELTTINAELQTKITDSVQANNDLNNLLAGSGIGTIFVDHQLLVKRFTPSVTRVINLIQSDVGRPLGHIVSNFADDEDLIKGVVAVLDNLIPRELELRTKEGDLCYLINIRPYRTLENVIEGAVLTFVDITRMKSAENAKRESENKKQILFDSINDGVIFIDKAGTIVEVNASAEKILGLSLNQLNGHQISDPAWEMINKDDSPVTRDSHPVIIALKTGRQVQNTIGICFLKDAQRVWIHIVAIPQFKVGENKPYQACMIFNNVSACYAKEGQ